MDAVKTGALIAQARKEKELTQGDLAQQLHVSVQAVSKWERGLNFPDITLLEPLAEQLELTVSELMAGERNAPPREETVRDSLRVGLTQLGPKGRRWRVAFVCLALLLALFGSWQGYVWVRDNTEWLPQKETVVTPRLLTATDYQSIKAAGQDMVFLYDVALADDFASCSFALELWMSDGLAQTWPLKYAPLDTRPPTIFGRHQTLALTFDFWMETEERMVPSYGLNFLDGNSRGVLDDIPFDTGSAVSYRSLKERTAVDPEHGIVLLALVYDSADDGFRVPRREYTGTGTGEAPHVYEGDAVVLLRMTCESD